MGLITFLLGRALPDYANSVYSFVNKDIYIVICTYTQSRIP